jgi:hypothetical protein
VPVDRDVKGAQAQGFDAWPARRSGEVVCRDADDALMLVHTESGADLSVGVL